MATKQIEFTLSDENLKIDTSTSCGVGQYFYVKMDGSNGTDSEYQASECMKLSISRIYYKKTIYKPGFVDVEMTIDNFEKFSSNKYADALRFYFLSANEKKQMRTLSLEKNTTKYIQDYYITDIAFKQKIVNNSRVTIMVLKAYSPDYFLTLQKYSKVYRGQKLSKIIENTLEKTFSGDDTILKSRFNHSYLCHTTDKSNNELKQPYLVQYNETFHDFVVRTANRCGELFYYEDGKLILGVDSANIYTADDKKNDSSCTENEIRTGTISNTLPEDMAFSTIPAPFIKNVKTIDKRYLNNIEETSSDNLYYNQNIEFADALHNTSMDDAMQASDMAEAQWYGVITKALNSGSFTDAITNASSKAIDIKMTAEMIAKGKAMPDKSKPCLQQCEVDINNSFHSNVASLSSTISDEAKNAFKANYEENHPEEFMEAFKTEYKPFDDSSSMASKALEAYLEKARNLSRNHKEEWKEKYKKDHPKEFQKETQLTDKEIFATGTDGEKYINEFIKKNSHFMTKAEIKQWKKEYEAGKGKEYFKGKTGDEKTMIWEDTTSQPYQDLQIAMQTPIPPTTDEIEQAKKQFKEDYPGKCVKFVDITAKEVEAKFNDATTAAGKAFQDYMTVFGNDIDNIITTEKDIEDNKCQNIFYKDKIKLSDADCEKIWKGSLDSKDKEANKEPYNELTKRFKEKYEKDHPREFSETGYKKVNDTKTIWDNTTSKPNKALKEYLDSIQDASNFSNKYYTWIEKQEKLCSDSIQVHRIVGSDIPTYKLGQYFTLSSSASTEIYLINQVEVEVTSHTGESEYKLDANITVSKTHTDKEREETNAYQYKTFPPMSDIPHIRKSEPQLAIVTDVADPQRAGRVQIRYPWSDEEKAKNANGETINSIKLDKDGNPKAGKSASPWIPVAVPFVGGADSGFLMTPDKDDYVMVNYEGGNIERPYVDGSIFHGAKSTNWGSVPLIAKAQDFRGTKHAITYKGNGITFAPGNANAFMTGLLPSVIGGPIAKFLDGENPLNKDMRFGGSMTLTDYYGTYSISMSSAGRSVNIDSPWGTVGINAFTGITISAPNGDIKIAGKNVTIEAGNKVEIVSGKNIKNTGVNFNSMFKEIGGAVAKVAGNAVGSALKNSLKTASGIDLGKALDLSFVRNVWEIIFRPVDGGLNVKSGRNLMLTAGAGKCKVPASTLSNAWKPKPLTSVNPFKLALQALNFTGHKVENEQSKEIKSTGIGKIMNEYCQLVDKEMADIKSCIAQLSGLSTALDDYIKNRLRGKFADGYKTLDKFLEKLVQNNVPGDYIKDGINLDEIEQVYQEALLQTMVLIVQTVEKLKNHLNGSELKAKLEGHKFSTSNIDPGDFKGLKGEAGKFDVDVLLLGEAASNDKLKDIAKNGTIEDAQYKKTATIIKRSTVQNIMSLSGLFEIKQGKDTWIPYTGEAVDSENDDAWANFCTKQVRFKVKELSDGEKIASSITNSFLSGAGLSDYASYNDSKGEWTFMGGLQKTFNINGVAGPRAIWDSSAGHGVVLISDNKDKSYRINAEGKLEVSSEERNSLDDVIANINKI